jgi:hypothetical protein
MPIKKKTCKTPSCTWAGRKLVAQRADRQESPWRNSAAYVLGSDQGRAKPSRMAPKARWPPMKDLEFYEYDDLPNNLIVRKALLAEGKDEAALIAIGDSNWYKNTSPVFIPWDEFKDKYQIIIDELEELEPEEVNTVMRPKSKIKLYDFS